MGRGSLALSIKNANKDTVNQITSQQQQGHTNNTVQATLNANALTTTVTFVNCTATSSVTAMPMTADAALETATMWIAPAIGQFVITHSSQAAVDRTFMFTVTG